MISCQGSAGFAIRVESETRFAASPTIESGALPRSASPRQTRSGRARYRSRTREPFGQQAACPGAMRHRDSAYRGTKNSRILLRRSLGLVHSFALDQVRRAAQKRGQLVGLHAGRGRTCPPASGAKVTRTSMSLSSRNSPRAAEPRRAELGDLPAARERGQGLGEEDFDAGDGGHRDDAARRRSRRPGNGIVQVFERGRRQCWGTSWLPGRPDRENPVYVAG